MKREPVSWQAYLKKARVFLRTGMAGLCAVLVVIDVTANNWELNDYIGNAQTFFTPVLNVLDKEQFGREFTFASGSASFASISNVGKFMVDYALKHISARDSVNYATTNGAYPILTSSMDICKDLVQSYPLRDTDTDSIKLALAMDTVRYIRGTTLDNFFSGERTSPPHNSNHAQLTALGFVPARFDVDTRLTSPLPIPQNDTLTSANVSMYRFLSRAFCTGCDPFTELGLDLCNVMYVYNSTSRVVTIKSSKIVPGELHMLGMMFQRSGITTGSLYVRGFAVLFVVAAYAISQKTVRWADSVDLMTWYKKLTYMLSPTLYGYSCNAFSFAYFCFNSDLFVVVYMIAVLLDEKPSLLNGRYMNNWNIGNDFWINIRIFSMNFRWVWLNCAVVKLLKWLVSFLTATRFNGRNAIVGFLNFSCVDFVYMAGFFLLFRTNFTDFGNRDAFVLSSTVQSLDGITIDFFESTFMRNYPSLFVCMVLNLLLVLGIDRLVNLRWWRAVKGNSLGRQNMYNTTSILSDMDYNFTIVEGFKGDAILVSARSLCTIQWFLTSHTLRFGLPEQAKRVRALTSKGMAGNGGGNGLFKKSIIAVKPTSSQLYGVEDSGMSQMTQGTEMDEDEEESAGSKGPDHVLHMLAQDKDGFIHLYNSHKSEVQALSLEVKIRSNSTFIII